MKILTDEEINFETTMIAIRESLMGYFKGGCIQSLVEETNVRIRSKRIEARRWSDRRELENANPSYLMIGQVKLAEVRHAPDRMMYLPEIQDNEITKKLHDSIVVFMSTYLPGVEIVERNIDA